MKLFRLFGVTAMVVYFLTAPQSVLADGKQDCTTTTGAYGKTSVVCKVLGEKHEPVPAGLGDLNFWILALTLTAGAAVLYGAAKASDRIYWFD